MFSYMYIHLELCISNIVTREKFDDVYSFLKTSSS